MTPVLGIACMVCGAAVGKRCSTVDEKTGAVREMRIAHRPRRVAYWQGPDRVEGASGFAGATSSREERNPSRVPGNK